MKEILYRMHKYLYTLGVIWMHPFLHIASREEIRLTDNLIFIKFAP